MADRRRGGERAGGAGRVEDLVVRAAEELADADADLVAGDRSPPAIAARCAAAPARPPSAAGNTTVAGWNTEPLCTSSCSTKCDAAALTVRREQRAACRAMDQDLRAARRPDPSRSRSARSPRPAARPCRPARSRTSRGTGLRRDARTGAGMSRNAGRGEAARGAWVGLGSAHGELAFKRRRRGAGASIVGRRRSRARRRIASVCSPSAGTASMRGVERRRNAGRQQRGHGPAGVSTSRQRSRACSCGCAQTSGIVVDARVGDLRLRRAARPPARRVSAREGLDDDRAQRLARGDARARSRRSARRSRARAARSTCAQNACHSRSFCRPEHHRLAVAGRERAVRIDRRVRGAGARRRRRRRRTRSRADSPSTRPCSRASRRRCGSRGRCGRAGSARARMLL